MNLPPVGVWSPVSSHSLVYQHLRLDSTPVLPLSEETSLPTPSSLSRVRVSDHTKFQHSSVLFSSVPTPTPFITHPILTAGTSGTLTCGYTLSPPLDVIASATWTVNGSSVTGDERISTDRLSLTLSPLTTSDTGTYTCTLTIISLTPYVAVLGPQQSRPEEVYVYSKTYYCSHVLTCCEFNLLLGAHPVEDFKNTAVSESFLSFSWSQPSIAGNLTTGYNLTCVPLLTGIPLPQSLQLPPTATSATVAGLRSGVTYNCSIFTITDQGHSQPLTLSNSTYETGSYCTL